MLYFLRKQQLNHPPLPAWRSDVELPVSPSPESSERLAELTAVTGRLCELERERDTLQAAAEELRLQLRAREVRLTELESEVGPREGTGHVVIQSIR